MFLSSLTCGQVPPPGSAHGLDLIWSRGVPLTLGLTPSPLHPRVHLSTMPGACLLGFVDPHHFSVVSVWLHFTYNEPLASGERVCG